MAPALRDEQRAVALRRDRLRRHPLPATEFRRQLVIGKPGEKQLLSKSAKEGGNQIEYEDQDPRIHELWLAEMRKAGITPKLELAQTVRG